MKEYIDQLRFSVLICTYERHGLLPVKTINQTWLADTR
jgi:hypothetical protein